jgi:proline-specific peptidase
MNGPNEFTIIGNMKYWDVTAQLNKIRIPTLVTGGRYDEVSPKVARSIHKGIKKSKLVTFANSSHLPMWEEREVHNCGSEIPEKCQVSLHLFQMHLKLKALSQIQL